MPTSRPLAEQVAAATDRPGPDLAVPALIIARLEYPALDPGHYLDILDTLGTEAAHAIHSGEGHDAPLPLRLDLFHQWFFGTQGFAGNTSHYDDPRNSCLNQVIARRTGIPLTLALVYMEVARRAGLRTEGINFPGHFLVRVLHDLHTDDQDEGLVVDVFHKGAILAENDCRALLLQQMGDDAVWQPSVMARATRRQVVMRMLLNLKRLYVRMRSFPQAREVSDMLLALAPLSMSELRDRGLLSYHMNDVGRALHDLEAYLKMARLTDQDEDERKESEQIWEHVKTLRRRQAQLN